MFPMSALYIILLIGVVSVSLLLLLLVLMQRPRQEGLGATFGVDVTSQMFGSRTTDVLQKGTVYLTAIFFVLCISIGLLNARTSKREAQLGKQLAEQAVPAPVLPPIDPATKTDATAPSAEAPPVPGVINPAGTPGPTTPAPAPSPTAIESPEVQKQLEERSSKYKEVINKLQESQKLVNDPAISEELRAQKRKEVDELAAEAKKLESEMALPAPGETPPTPTPTPEPPKTSP
jgi:preprotein translocase subunit SecG